MFDIENYRTAKARLLSELGALVMDAAVRIDAPHHLLSEIWEKQREIRTLIVQQSLEELRDETE